MPILTHIASDVERCTDDIVSISDGRIRAAGPKDCFVRGKSKPGETLEQVFLRLQGGGGPMSPLLRKETRSAKRRPRSNDDKRAGGSHRHISDSLP